MAAQKKLRAVIFIEKTFCQIGFENNPTIFTFQYPPAIISDLEILQLDEFHKQFLAFLAQNKIAPADYIMVLGNNLFFVKDIQNVPKQPPVSASNSQTVPAPQPASISEEQEIQNFLSNVPFENVSFKVFKKDPITRILAANRDLFEAFKKALEKQGGKIEVIIPAFAFELFKNIKLGQSFSADSIKLVLKNIDDIKEQSMLVNQEPDESDDDVKQQLEPPSPIHDPKKRIWALGGTFGVLILVLGVLVVTQFVLPKDTKQAAITPTLPPFEIAEVPASPTPTVASVSAELKAQTTIQIQSTASQRAAATNLRNTFVEDGYSNVQLGTTNTNSTNTQVVVKPDLDPGVKTDVSELVTATYPNASILENADIQFDINITVAASNSASTSIQ